MCKRITKFALWDEIRTLGHADHSFAPEEMLDLLISQYIELWRDRVWLKDRVTFASRTGQAFFHDGKHFSAESEVMYELPLIFAAIRKRVQKAIWNREDNASIPLPRVHPRSPNKFLRLSPG